MANKINLTLKVNDDGSLDITAKKAKKAAQETEKLGQATNKAAAARNRYNKGEKGVAQAGMNSTKAFSKMRSEMGSGSSGLVGAYATLAANVFAATAAFGALQRAAEFDQLTQSVEFFGNAAGRNLERVANKLQTVTDGALSAEGAFRGTALAISSGFSTEQIEKLAVVAKGASSALGRDLNDAFDRLVRGAAKLEPEILDELGIMVRLDDAVQAYASELGKAVTSLSAFEKRQAFLNAINKQGLEQFGDLAASVDVNPYNQLAAAFNNLTKAGIGLLNKVLVPAAQFFAQNQTALIGGVTLFASTISRQMLPALAEGAQRLTQNALAQRDLAVSHLSSLDAVSKNDTAFNRYLQGLQDGTKTVDNADEAFGSLQRTVDAHQRGINKLNKDNADDAAQIERKNGLIEKAKVQRGLLTKAVIANSLATAQNTQAQAANAFANLQFIEGFAGIGDSMRSYGDTLDRTAKENGKAKASFRGLRVGLFGVTGAVKGLSGAFFSLLGPIGLLLTLGPAILAFFKEKFFPEDEAKSKFAEIASGIDKLVDAEEQYTKSSLEGSAKRVAGYKAALGMQQEIATAILDTLALEVESGTAVTGEISAKEKELDLLKQRRDALLEVRKTIKMNKQESNALFNEQVATSNAITRTEKDLKRLRRGQSQALKDQAGQGENTIAIIDNALEQLTSTPQLATFMSPTIKQLEDFKERIGKGEDVSGSLKEFLEGLKTEAIEGTEVNNSFEQSLDQLGVAFTKFSQKQRSPFSDVVDAAAGVEEKFLSLGDIASEELGAGLRDANLEKFKEDLLALFGTTDVTQEGVSAFVQKLRDARDTIENFPNALKASQTQQKVLNQVAQHSVTAFEAANDELDKSFNLRQAEIDAQRTFIEANSKLSEDEKKRLQAEQNLRQQQLDADKTFEIAEIRKLKSKQIQLGLDKQMLDIAQKIAQTESTAVDLKQKSLEIAAKARNLADPTKRTAELTPIDELNIQKKVKDEKIAAAEEELKLKNEMVDIETELEKLKIEVIREQLNAAGQLTIATSTTLTTMQKNLDSLGEKTKANNKLSTQNVLDNIDLEDDAAKRRALEFLSGKSAGGVSGLLELQRSRVGEGDDAQSGLDFLMNEGELRDKVEFAKGLTAEFQESLKSLGPDGEFVAAVTQGAFAITDAFVGMGEVLKSNATENEKSAAKYAMVGAAIGAANSMIQAGYQRNIANIDAQIAAEKKRDGQSAASLAKIAAMEKKKEQQQRKAFEMNKKMLIAQTIMNTAAAVMATMKDTGFFGSPLAMIVAAMGAAQVAMIASQSFQGGGSGGSGSTGIPSSVNIGNRRDSVDISKSQSARGELAYFRGEAGTGGPENFRGAFAGYRNRAEGGTTGFMVGEQGPELFMPDRPGSIVPNDDIAETAPTNVTFNINAIDAVGVEEVISTQRGNIIGMIRSAANSYGQDFIESVDTTVFDDNTIRSQAGSVSRY